MNKTCPRCGSSFEPDTTVDQICAQCAFSAVLDTESTSDYSSSKSEADTIVRNLDDLDDVSYISQGGMGILYKAHQKKMNREIAIKVISGHFQDDPEFMERFEREIKTLGSLNHPNIVTIHDSGFCDDVPYFIMEYVEGKSLREKMQEESMSSSEALGIIKTIAEALKFAHNRGVIHRDVKPENILIGKDGSVKVVDFGIAQVRDELTQLTSSHKMMGSPKYMAPEQMDSPNQTDHRVDIYTLSVMAYELLTGKVPRGTFPAPSTLSNVDDNIDKMIFKGMRTDPNERQQSMSEFLDEINYFLDSKNKINETELTTIELGVRIEQLKNSRLIWAILAGGLFQIIFFCSQVIETFNPDPQFILEDYTYNSQNYRFYELDRMINQFNNDYPKHKTADVLKSAASSQDHKIAAAAVSFAYSCNRIKDIPPLDRFRILIQWKKKYDFRMPTFSTTLLDNINSRETAIVDSIVDGGEDISAMMYQDILAGKIKEDYLLAVSEGLARIASPEVLRNMHDYLINNIDSKYYTAILYAFTSRTFLPPPMDLNMTDEVKQIYIKHLPNVFDKELAEVKWEDAVNLGSDIIKIKAEDTGDATIRITDVWEWMPVVGVFEKNKEGRYLSPAEKIARYHKLPWPMNDQEAQKLSKSIENDEWKQSTFKKLLLLRWRNKEKFTIPYYPSESTTNIHSIRYMGLNKYQSRSLKRVFDYKSKLKRTRWEIQSFFVPTIGGLPINAGSQSGTGKVQCDVRTDIAGFDGYSKAKTSFHFGLSNITKKKSRGILGSFKLNVTGEMKKDNEGLLVVDGNINSSFAGGMGSSGFSSPIYPEQASVIRYSLTGSRSGHLRYGHFTIFVPSPNIHESEDARWRTALANSIERISSTPSNIIGLYNRENLASLCAWFPIPKSKTGLKKIWNDYREFGIKNNHTRNTQKFYDYCGAGLLMLGDTTPLEDHDFLKRLNEDIALRIYLFSESQLIRDSVKSVMGKPQTYFDAIVIKNILDKRNEKNSSLANAVIKKIEEYKKTDFDMDLIFPYILLLLVVLFLVYHFWKPFPGNHFQWSGSLIATGMLFRFVTIEMKGIVWIPILSYLLFLVASFICGKMLVKGISVILLFLGFLEMMMPSSQLIASLSSLMFCIYVGILSLDYFTRLSVNGLKFWEGLSFLLTWWLLIVPMTFLYGFAIIISLAYEGSTAELFTMSRDLYDYLVFLMCVSPALFVLLSRRRIK